MRPSHARSLQRLFHSLVASAAIPAAAGCGARSTIVGTLPRDASPTPADALADARPDASTPDARPDAAPDARADVIPFPDVICRGTLISPGPCTGQVAFDCPPLPNLPVDTTINDSAVCDALCIPYGALRSGSGPCSVYRDVTNGGRIVVSCELCAVGRRPDGFVPRSTDEDGNPVGVFFARIAELESASVHAFERLLEVLKAHDAPRKLVSRVRAAARDEVRHARVMGDIARRFGGDPVHARVAPAEDTSIAALAVENASEGCVRETFGALVATWQSEHAQDVDVRRALRDIAEDETRHASLSWALDAWFRDVLDPQIVARMDAARAAAVAQLSQEVRVPVRESLIRDAGMPGHAALTTLFDGVSSMLVAA